MGVRRETTTMRSGKSVTRWRVDVTYRHPDGRKERVAKVAQIQTRRGAEQEERDIIAALQDGSYNVKRGATKVITFREFEAEYFRSYVDAELKPSGKAGKRAMWRDHILPTFGSTPLDGVTPRMLAQYVASRRETYTPKSINNQLSAISQTLKQAAKWHIITKDAIPEIDWLRVPEQGFSFLDYGQARALVEAAAVESPWGQMITIGILTGMRHGELRALQWTAVDMDNRRISVHRAAWKGEIGGTKNGRARSIPFSDTVAEVLESLPDGGGFVFTVDGSLLTKEQCKWPLYRACDRAGLKRLGWHALRHTFASHLVMRNAPLPVVQKLLGHSDIRMTMRYAHLAPEATVDAIGLLDAGLKGLPEGDDDG